MYQGYKGLGQTFGSGGTAPAPGTPPTTPTPGQPVNPTPNAPQTPGQMATPQTPMPGPAIGQQIQQNVQQPIAGAMQTTPPMPAIPQQPRQSLFSQLTQGIDINALPESQQRQLHFFNIIADKLEAEGKGLDDPALKRVGEKIKAVLKDKSGVLTEEASRGISKESLVSTPQGVGEVKAVNNGKAIVEVNGKAVKIDEKDIQPPPIPENDLADLHTELISGIEKQTGKQVSRNVNWAGYDPDAKELLYRPWNGDSYTYTDIEPEDVEMLTSFLTQRKTTGENFIGAWEQDTESPIGAARHKLIMKLKEKAKAKGEKEYTRKYQTVYSAYEPAEKAAKLKKKLAEQEERKKRKNAKKA
jgi:hypothetical protein